MFFTKSTMITPERALPGRERPVLTPGTSFHEVLGTRIDEVPDGAEVAYFALGCFWGAEKLFWQQDGVITTAVGYQGGYTPNPTYEEVCSGHTGQAEAVKVVFDPTRTSYAALLTVFLENHDPTQGMRQGNDRGTQYRSAIYPTGPEQEAAARAAITDYQPKLSGAGYGEITTEVAPAGPFYYAERYHQQYLDKNPNGYCPVHATGVTCG
ncbi:MAG: peptide-methionine (S)-S-oxide reductase MsrA [Propionibacteriaceae bacterium]|nr:peptide-methionine (S)-S-oxide reductase MsrA [Propionibacteriaceae bacterium]